MTTTERMKMYLEYRKIPVSRAEKACGFGNATLVSAFKNPSASLGSEKLEIFLSTYQDLSAEWLLRGEGNMIIGEGVNYEQLLKSMDLPVNSREIINIWLKFMEFNQGMQEIYKQTIVK